MFYPEDFANFALEKSFVPKVPFFLYCDVYEHGKLGISVNTSLIMALIKQYFVKYIFGCKLTNCQDISRSRIRRRSFDMMLSLRLYPNNKKWHSSRAYVVI